MATRTRNKRPHWKKEDFFPLIGRNIEELYRVKRRFIRRDEIAEHLSRDERARKFLDQGALDTNAGNIVDWFSAHFKMFQNGDKRFLKWGPLFSGFERADIQRLAAYKPISLDDSLSFPDEVGGGVRFREGAVRQVLVNAYERDLGARRQCIAKYGDSCFICNFSFAGKYGKAAEGFIHVHHLRQLSEIREEYVVDPERDLRPVCPNCHAVLHRRNPPYTIEEVRNFLESH